MTGRRLAAILVADVVGYSKLVSKDEAGTLAKLQALRANIIEPVIAKHAGRLFKAVGDGFLVEFASAVQAVEAAQATELRYHAMAQQPRTGHRSLGPLKSSSLALQLLGLFLQLPSLA